MRHEFADGVVRQRDAALFDLELQVFFDALVRECVEAGGIESVLPEQHSREQQRDERPDAECAQDVLRLQAVCGYHKVDGLRGP
jgi:hypothetical protein